MDTVRLSILAMATRFELVMHGADARRLRAAGEEALSEIERLDRQLSAYRSDSDVSRINAQASYRPVKVEPRLLELLRTAQEIHDLTDCAFEITVRPLLRAWGLVDGQGRIPSAEEIEAARAAVGMDNIVLDENACAVRFARAGVQIDLGAIGKGCAIDRAVESLCVNGIESALIHGGTSSIYGIGSPPGHRAWNVAIRSASPRERNAGAGGFSPSPWGEGWGEGEGLSETVALRDSSLSVSKPYGKSFTRCEKTYGHVIDPRSGQPVQGARMAAVTGPRAAVCDALSTALLVLGCGWLPELEKRFPGYRGIA